MFVTYCLKFFLSQNGKTSQEKNSTCHMFDTNNICTRIYVCRIKLYCLQADTKIT